MSTYLHACTRVLRGQIRPLRGPTVQRTVNLRAERAAMPHALLLEAVSVMHAKGESGPADTSSRESFALIFASAPLPIPANQVSSSPGEGFLLYDCIADRLLSSVFACFNSNDGKGSQIRTGGPVNW